MTTTSSRRLRPHHPRHRADPASSGGRVALLDRSADCSPPASIAWGILSLVGLLAHEEQTTADDVPRRHPPPRGSASTTAALRLRGTDADQIRGTRNTSRGLAPPDISESVLGRHPHPTEPTPGPDERMVLGRLHPRPAGRRVGHRIRRRRRHRRHRRSRRPRPLVVGRRHPGFRSQRSAHPRTATPAASKPPICPARSSRPTAAPARSRSASTAPRPGRRPPTQRRRCRRHRSWTSPAVRATARSVGGPRRRSTSRPTPPRSSTISATSSAGPVSVTYGPPG